MKAIVKSKAEPGLWIEDVPEPEMGINDVMGRTWSISKPVTSSAPRGILSVVAAATAWPGNVRCVQILAASA